MSEVHFEIEETSAACDLLRDRRYILTKVDKDEALDHARRKATEGDTLDVLDPKGYITERYVMKRRRWKPRRR